MPSVIIRPDATVSAGNWSIQDGLIAGVLGDQNVATEVLNTSGNQSIITTLSDVSGGLGAQQFTSATITVSAKQSGKGTATFSAFLLDGSNNILSTANFTATSTTYSNFDDAVSVNFDNDQVNNLRLMITTTGNTQAFFNEAFVTLEYGVVESNGEVILSSGLIQLTSGKVTL